MKVSLYVRAKNVHPGESVSQLPEVVITFYDQNRTPLDDATVGPWRGTFEWQRESRRIPVPTKAREANLLIGLLGATGELSMDAVKVERDDEK